MIVRKRIAWILGLLLVAGHHRTALAVPVLFTADYSQEGFGEGFNDLVLGPARKLAFEYSLSILNSQFTARYVGETYVVRATFDPLGGSAGSAVLGSAGPNSLYSGIANPIVAAAYYPAALASHRHMADVNNGNPINDRHEVEIQFNTDVDNSTVLGNTNWYYGFDANPGSHVDFATVALHELAHGIGFTGLLTSTGAYIGPGLYSIYDHFMNTSATGGSKLTSLTNAGRLAEITSNDLWWDGALGTAGNGGVRPKLYAPAAFAGGSSLYHLDEGTLGSELLSPFYSGADHTYSAAERGMLADMGWTLAAIPEAHPMLMMTLATCVAGVGIAVKRSRRN